MDSTIPLLPKSEFSSLYSSPVAVQPVSWWTWSKAPKTGFLTSRLQYVTGVPGLLGPKPFRPGTPRPKSIFILGLLGPVIKNTLFVAYNGNKCIFSVFYFNIRFSTIGKRNVKKESMFSYKQMYFLFHVGHPSRPRTLRPIFTTIDF